MENQIKKFYDSLPEPIHPKKDFIEEAADACKVSPHTVRAWIFQGKRPSPECCEILAQLSGGKINLVNNQNSQK